MAGGVFQEVSDAGTQEAMEDLSLVHEAYETWSNRYESALAAHPELVAIRKEMLAAAEDISVVKAQVGNVLRAATIAKGTGGSFYAGSCQVKVSKRT
jgi:hypothetical protein